MILLQLDLDIAVLRTHYAGIVVRQVDARNRQPDVVGHRLDLVRRNDLADRLLNVGKLIGAFLKPRAYLNAHMHQDLAGIDRGEEVLPEIGHHHERGSDEAQKTDYKGRPVVQRQRQQVAMSAAKLLEPAFEAALKRDQRTTCRQESSTILVQIRLKAR